MAIQTLFIAASTLGCGPSTEPVDSARTAQTVPASRPAATSETHDEGGSARELRLDSVTELTVRVVSSDGPWAHCGILHVFGYVEVEVLGAGEPPPRLGLLLSCPAAFGGGGLFSVGNRAQVTLYDELQPNAARPPDVPPDRIVRQVRSATEAGDVHPPR